MVPYEYKVKLHYVITSAKGNMWFSGLKKEEFTGFQHFGNQQIPNHFLIPNHFPTKTTWLPQLFRSKIPKFSIFSKMLNYFTDHFSNSHYLK